ncbi:MAG: polysaccharide pyruvyl transferase family protein [Akkermansiaceae bacterium]|nr:polysaccharide pyruvyl transferase family protein [Akkermansiaceae bacterium]
MKVGILTYHYGANYGGTLQAYALQEAVKHLGHDAEVINFQPNPRRLPPPWRGLQLRHPSLENFRRKWLQLRFGSQSFEQFEEFRASRMSLSPVLNSVEALAESSNAYDAIITGSDQIWNFRCSPAYFLALGEKYRGRKIAYAPCCTQEEQPAERIERVGSWIRDYDALSVRDAFSRRAVRNASGRDASIVCDPTLLMGDAWPVSDVDWSSHREEILLYRLGPPMEGDFGGLIQGLRGELGNIPVRGMVASTFNPVVCNECDEVDFVVSPIEWVQRIRHCKFLITDSFHGVLFALRYGVPFMAYYRDAERAPRLMDLRTMFSLDERIVTTPPTTAARIAELLKAPPSPPQMKGLIEESWQFLSASLA